MGRVKCTVSIFIHPVKLPPAAGYLSNTTRKSQNQTHIFIKTNIQPKKVNWCLCLQTGYRLKEKPELFMLTLLESGGIVLLLRAFCSCNLSPWGLRSLQQVSMKLFWLMTFILWLNIAIFMGIVHMAQLGHWMVWWVSKCCHWNTNLHSHQFAFYWCEILELQYQFESLRVINGKHNKHNLANKYYFPPTVKDKSLP